MHVFVYVYYKIMNDKEKSCQTLFACVNRKASGYARTRPLSRLTTVASAIFEPKKDVYIRI